jgi:hypothetical protein
MLAMALPDDLAATRCRCRVMLVMVLLSHAGDNAAGRHGRDVI